MIRCSRRSEGKAYNDGGRAGGKSVAVRKV